MEAVEGGGAERGSERKKEEKTRRMKKCEKIGAREVKVSLRGWAALCLCARVRVCVHSAPACVRLEVFKPSLCVHRVCVYVWVLLCM